MILGAMTEGSSRIATDQVEVRVSVRLIEAGKASMSEVMETMDNAVEAALVASGVSWSTQVIEQWHKSRADEARAKEDI